MIPAATERAVGRLPQEASRASHHATGTNSLTQR